MLSSKIKEIKLLMEYAVPKDEMAEALRLLEQFDTDRIALNLLHSFYSYLPEGLDDSISKLLLIERKNGIFLLCAITGIDSYLYVVSQDKAEFLGRRDEGIWDEEVLEFFGFKDREASLKRVESLSNFPAYSPAHINEDLCPVCSAASGEIHTLGCPVEICPWCSGQLTSCNCRFTMAGRQKLLSEHDLSTFKEQLENKGRVPYDAKSHRPGYPAAGEDKPC